MRWPDECGRWEQDEDDASERKTYVEPITGCGK